MKTYRLVFRQVDRDKFNAVISGSKPIETRAATSKYRDVKAGDVLLFKCGKDTVEKVIKKVEHYPSLDALIAGVPVPKSAIIPGAETMDDIYKAFYGFPGYEAKIAQHGLMAFYL